jgi:hypothetical protein
MTFDYNSATKVLLVIIAIVILIALILKCNKKYKQNGYPKRVKEDFMYPQKDKTNKKNSLKEKYEDMKKESQTHQNREQKMKIEMEKSSKQKADSLKNFPDISQPLKASDGSKDAQYANFDHDAYNVQPMENIDNDDYKAIDFSVSSGQPSDCYPRDRLTTDDLLPRDAANSKFAEINPAGQGDVKDQNFLPAGAHFGIDTVGQTLKNPNMQLRSDPPIAKIEGLSPWNNSTYEYDSNRRHFEIS